MKSRRRVNSTGWPLRFVNRWTATKETMKIKVLISLCLTIVLCLLSPIAESQNEERLRFVVPAAPWVLSLAKGNLVIDQQQIKPDGSAGYFSLNDEKNRLTVSFFIEPVTKCNDSKSCRDMVLKLGNPSWEKPENVIRSEIEGVSYFEFFMPSFRGIPIKQQHMYVEFVMDGFWVDLHISKALYTSRDHDVFDQLVKSVKFEPQKVRSAQDPSTKVATRSYKVSTVGRVEMSVPVKWQENVRLLEVPPAFTLAYRLPSTKDFYMKVTSAWEPQQERASRDPGWLRRGIERLTAQNYYTHDIGSVLNRLAQRLSENGVFFSHSHDGAWKPPARRRHYTEPWFHEAGWTIWNGRTGRKPPGRVAWLFTSTG
jgi:hypothetical protein